MSSSRCGVKFAEVGLAWLDKHRNIPHRLKPFQILSPTWVHPKIMLNILIILLAILYVILCAGMIFMILIQPAKKGGGLGGIGGGGAAISDSLGATQAEQTLAKITQYGMALFFVLSLGLTLLANYSVNSGKIQLPAAAPAAAAPAPAGDDDVSVDLQSILDSAASQAAEGETPATGATIQIPAAGTTASEAPSATITIPATEPGS